MRNALNQVLLLSLTILAASALGQISDLPIAQTFPLDSTPSVTSAASALSPATQSTRSTAPRSSEQTPSRAELLELKRLIDTGEFETARARLQDPQSMETLLARAQLELKDKRPTAAIPFLKEALRRDPDLPRARFDYATALEQSGKSGEALRQLDQVEGVPEATAAQIDRYAESIKRRQRVRSNYSLGLLYDDNVNIGPTRDVVEVFELPFTLTPESRPQDDLALLLGAQASGQGWHHQDWRVDMSAAFSHIAYLDNGEFDYTALSLRGGPNIDRDLFGYASTIGSDLIANLSFLDGDIYYTSLSAQAWSRTRLDEIWSLHNAFTIELADNDQFSGRSGNTLGWQGALQHLTPQGTRVLPRVSLFYDNADEKVFASTQYSAGVGIYHDFSPRIGGYTELLYRGINFDEREAANRAARDDDQIVFVVNLGTDLPWWDTKGTVGFTLINNNSNIGFNDYERNQFTIQISKSY